MCLVMMKINLKLKRVCGGKKIKKYNMKKLKSYHRGKNSPKVLIESKGTSQNPIENT